MPISPSRDSKRTSTLLGQEDSHLDTSSDNTESSRKHSKYAHASQPDMAPSSNASSERPSLINGIDVDDHNNAAGSELQSGRARGDTIRMVANGDLDEEISKDKPEALTAHNVGLIPEADQLAPGIRLPEHEEEEGEEDDHHSNDGSFSNAQDAGVPPELDPRTSRFRPPSPGAASVFSVAVQPPGSPKPSVIDSSEHYGGSDSRMGGGWSSAGGTSSRPASVRASSPPLSAGFNSEAAFSRSGGPNSGSGLFSSGGPLGRLAGSSLSRPMASVTPSEVGSASSSSISGLASSTGHEGDDVEARMAAIEEQRMLDRESYGGEAGVGGLSYSSALPLHLRDEMIASSLTAGPGAGGVAPPSRAGSTSATVGTSSPPASLSGTSDYAYPDIAAHSRRGSADTIGSTSASVQPPSELGSNSGHNDGSASSDPSRLLGGRRGSGAGSAFISTGVNRAGIGSVGGLGASAFTMAKEQSDEMEIDSTAASVGDDSMPGSPGAASAMSFSEA